MKTGQKVALGAGIGLFAYALLHPKTAQAAAALLPGGGGDFETFQGVRFWSKAAIPKLRQFLANHFVNALGDPSLPQPAELVMSAIGTDQGLAWVQKKQKAGWFVATTDDLLNDASQVPRMLATLSQDMNTAIVAAKASEGWAVLPVL